METWKIVTRLTTKYQAVGRERWSLILWLEKGFYFYMQWELLDTRGHFADYVHTSGQQLPSRSLSLQAAPCFMASEKRLLLRLATAPVLCRKLLEAMLGSYLCFRVAPMSELSSKSQYGLPQPFMAFPFSPKVPILQVMLQILYFLVRLNVPFPHWHVCFR